MLSQERRGFEKEYTEGSFWQKLLKFAQRAGIEVVEKTLMLYYAAQSPHTPLWAKTTIYGALGYFISTIDAIPDVVPGAGFSDDYGVLVAALATVAFYIDAEVKEKAANKLRDWFNLTPEQLSERKKTMVPPRIEEPPE